MTRSPSRRKATSRKSARRAKAPAKTSDEDADEDARKNQARKNRPDSPPAIRRCTSCFGEQAAAVLDDADIGEEEKQSILLAMSCPCCGAGTMSFSVKMKLRGGSSRRRSRDERCGMG